MNEILNSPMDDTVFTTNLVVMGIIAQGVLDSTRTRFKAQKRPLLLKKNLLPMHPCTSFLRRLEMSENRGYTLPFIAVAFIVVYTGILCSHDNCYVEKTSFAPLYHVPASN